MEPSVPNKRNHCIRCGECCEASSPTLQMPDLSLILEGNLALEDLYTVRIGEMVQDPIQGLLRTTEQELLKVRERPEGGCTFYDPDEKGCSRYSSRPLQCSSLTCWDMGPFLRVHARPKAARRDILRDSDLLRLMAEHDRRCAYQVLEAHVRAIPQEGESAVQAVLQILRFDHDLRKLMPQRLNVNEGRLDFLLGRPLSETIGMFGLKVMEDPDGSFLLTVADSFETD